MLALIEGRKEFLHNQVTLGEILLNDRRGKMSCDWLKSTNSQSKQKHQRERTSVRKTKHSYNKCHKEDKKKISKSMQIQQLLCWKENQRIYEYIHWYEPQE